MLLHELNKNDTTYWYEMSKSVIMTRLEDIFNENILQESSITDIIIHDDKCMLKFSKRIIPLTNENNI